MANLRGGNRETRITLNVYEVKSENEGKLRKIISNTYLLGARQNVRQGVLKKRE